jgi:hypothetical protein
VNFRIFMSCVSCYRDTNSQIKPRLMTKFLTVAFLSLTLISCGQKTQPVDKDKQRLDKVCDTFMQTFSKGQYKDALTLLRQNSVLEQEKIDTLTTTITRQSENVFPYYGKIISSEFITERKIKDFIAKRFYILRFDKYYLKFDFTLYKGTSGWTITSFSYDEELIELLF